MYILYPMWEGTFTQTGQAVQLREAICSHDEVRQPCLYFKDSEEVFGSKGSVASLDTIPTGWLTAVSVLDGLAESHHLQYNFVGKLCWRTRTVVRWSNFHISIFWCGLGWCQGPNESPAGTTGSCDSNHVTRQLAKPRGPHKFPSISLSKLRSQIWGQSLQTIHWYTYGYWSSTTNGQSVLVLLWS